MKRVYRLLGIPVWSITSDEEPADEELTADDNGGSTYSDRIDVGFVQGSIDRTEGWDDRR